MVYPKKSWTLYPTKMYFGWQILRSPKRNMKVIQFCSYDFCSYYLCSYDITILLIDDIPSFKTDWNLFPITANLAFRCQNLCPVHCGFYLRHIPNLISTEVVHLDQIPLEPSPSDQLTIQSTFKAWLIYFDPWTLTSKLTSFTSLGHCQSPAKGGERPTGHLHIV